MNKHQPTETKYICILREWHISFLWSKERNKCIAIKSPGDTCEQFSNGELQLQIWGILPSQLPYYSFHLEAQVPSTAEFHGPLLILRYVVLPLISPDPQSKKRKWSNK